MRIEGVYRQEYIRVSESMYTFSGGKPIKEVYFSEERKAYVFIYQDLEGKYEFPTLMGTPESHMESHISRVESVIPLNLRNNMRLLLFSKGLIPVINCNFYDLPISKILRSFYIFVVDFNLYALWPNDGYTSQAGEMKFIHEFAQRVKF